MATYTRLIDTNTSVIMLSYFTKKKFEYFFKNSNYCHDMVDIKMHLMRIQFYISTLNSDVS